MTINTQAFATALANASLMCSVLCVRQARQCGRDLTSGCFVFVFGLVSGFGLVLFSALMRSSSFSLLG